MPLRTPFLRSVGIVGGLRAAAKLLRHPQNDPHTVPEGGPKKKQEPKSEASGPPGAGGASSDTSSHDASLANVYGPIGYGKELFTRFSADFCPAWAAALSFFSILSIVPVLLCGLAVLGFLIQSPEAAAQKVQEIVANLLPGAAAQQQAQQIIKDAKIEQSAADLMAKRGVAGIFGIGSLFWTALQIVLNATTPMNAAFRAKETRNWIMLRVQALGILVGAGALFLLSLLPAAGAEVINKLPIPGFDRLHSPLPPVISVVALLVGIAINAGMFSLIYRYLPSPAGRVSWREAGVAGGIVAVLWEIAKRVFAFYLTKFGAAGYNKMYGSLGGLIALIFWIYYSSMLLLLGAEIAKLYSDAQAAKKARTI